MRVTTILTRAVLAAAVLAALPASAATWRADAWQTSPQEAGHCQLDEKGSAHRLQIRSVSCVMADGTKVRDQDCDGRTKPSEVGWVSCRMQWSCSGWHAGVFAEGEKGKVTKLPKGGSVRVAATIACTNAKEADPARVSSCRASLADGMLERLEGESPSTSSNENYAWISCSKAVE